MERKICQECKIEIHQEVKSYNGEEKLSWRNPDGSPHYFFEDGKFVHTPTRDGYLEVRLKTLEAEVAALWEVVKGK